MTPTIFTFLALSSLLLLLITEYIGPRWLRYIFKPLTLLIIIALVWFTPHSISAHYRQFILIGLGFSLIGDAFLLFPKRWFLAGLFSFMLTHVFYITAFTEGLSNDVSISLIIIFTAIILLFSLISWKHLGSFRIPVTIYAGVIMVMVGSAAERYIQVGSTSSLLGLCGAVLFLISDGILAVNRFLRPFRAAKAIILSTYFVAQWLIALSVRG